MVKYKYRIPEHRLVFFVGPEAPEAAENTSIDKFAEKQNVDNEFRGNQWSEKRGKVQAAEKQDQAICRTQQTEIAQEIDAQPTPEVLKAISQIETMYKAFARRMYINAHAFIDMTVADTLLEPVCRAWNSTRLGPKRNAIENALNAALLRATAETPNVEFHISTVGGSLGIAGSGGSLQQNDRGLPASERTNGRPSPTSTVTPQLQRFMSYLRYLFGRTSMEMGTPSIDRFNRESALAVASVSPGTQWNGPDRNGQPQPDSLVLGAFNLEIRFRAPMPGVQHDQFMDMVVHAADGRYGANGTNDSIRIQSLTPQQISLALEAARRWELAQTAGNRANDQLRGVPLQDRSAVLNSYRLLQTNVQRAYFRSIMGRASLEIQVPLSRVLARLTLRMTQDLLDGGPLHQGNRTTVR